MGFDYKETAKLLASIEGIQEKYNSFLEGFLAKKGNECLRETKIRTPVDTGALRNSWELSPVTRSGDTLYITISSGAIEYASDVEFGHWQHERFLPIHYLDNGSRKSKKMASDIRAKYGVKTAGVLLKEKWIPGRFMVSVPFKRIERELPNDLEVAIINFVKSMGVK